MLLREGRSAAAGKAYLATVRSAYRKLLRDNQLRDFLFAGTSSYLPPSDRKAFVDEALIRLQNAVHPEQAAVQVPILQDEADSEHLRLSARQAEQLLAAPDVTALAGLRNAALIALRNVQV